MGAFWGSLSALFIGFSDLFGRRVVVHSTVLTAAVSMQFVGIFSSLAAIVLVSSEFRWGDVTLGGLSGLGLGTGLACYYGGLSRSSSTVVAPVVATLSAVIPFGYTVVTGDTASALALAGAMVAFVGLAMITAGGTSATRVRTGLLWGLLSGLGYGFGLSVVIEVSADSGAWPAVSQRVAAFVMLGAIAVRTAQPLIPPAGLRVAALWAGAFAGLTTVFYLLGVQANATAAVITASMFPAASVAIGHAFYRDPVSRLQLVGLGVVLAGVAAVVTA